MTCEEVLDAILKGEPTLAFLERTQNGLDPSALASLVRALRATATMPKGLVDVATLPQWDVMDVCGTGGAKGSRLNTSTLTALFLPDLGLRVAKHGGRSASGKKGSLDLLDALGLNPERSFEAAPETLRSSGLCYLGAAFTYSCFARYAPLRKAFGKPTLFNLLGPLLNPTPLRTRLLGCRTHAVQDLLAETLLHLHENALLVCSEDDEGPLDEGAPWSETRLVWVSSLGRKEMRLEPFEAKPALREDLFSDGVAAALALLNGAQTREAESAARMVGFNVSLAVLAAGQSAGALRATAWHNADISKVRHAVHTLYEDFLAGRHALVERARARIASLSSLVKLDGLIHANSPVKVPSNLVSVQTQLKFDTERGAEIGLESKAPAAIAFPWRADKGLLIAEVKRSTPTRGFSSALSLADRVRAYDAAGADALSVVTHPSFQGDLSLLREVRSLTRKPLLAKDFIRTEEEAVALVKAGADGVLVLLDLVGEDQARRLARAVTAAGATPFVESTFEVPSFGVPMLNSRNLFTLREGREHRDALARRLPAGVPFVLASSLATPEDAVLARALGGAVVVGGALMELGDSRSVEAWIARARAGGLLKACGAQDADDARSALAAGASLVGVNLIPSSKRCLQKEALAGFLEDDALLARTVFLTDAHTPRDLVDQINSSGKAFAYEQCYFSPRLLGAKGLFHVGAVAYLEEGANSSCPSPRARARILDSSLPGSGKVEPYVSHGLSTPRLPTLCAGGVSPETAEARAKEARLRGHAVCGFDAASGVERRGAQGTQNQDQRSGFDPDAVAFLATLAREL